MRFLDSGSRDSDSALSSWLRATLIDEDSVAELRWQTGFFTADILGYFTPTFARLAGHDGLTHLLVGSNDGTTQRADVEVLRRAVGAPRGGLKVGVVSFGSGYFHPKTVHVTRDDGSAAAYVGSANLTGSGVNSLHVEAGLVLDSREGDSDAVLGEIASAIDRWFAEGPAGLYLVDSQASVDQLEASGVLGRPRPQNRRAPGGSASSSGGGAPTLTRLTNSPPLPEELRELLESAAAPALEAEAAETADPPPGTAEPSDSPAAVGSGSASGTDIVAEWSKTLPASDAQRKASGNQSGAVALTQAGHDIDAQTYFHEVFFASAQWVSELTNTQKIRYAATVPFAATVNGQDLGTLAIRITYAPNRESSQSNYTSLLHLGPLSQLFHDEDLTGSILTLRRLADGTFTLTITTPS